MAFNTICAGTVFKPKCAITSSPLTEIIHHFYVTPISVAYTHTHNVCATIINLDCLLISQKVLSEFLYTQQFYRINTYEIILSSIHLNAWFIMWLLFGRLIDIYTESTKWMQHTEWNHHFGLGALFACFFFAPSAIYSVMAFEDVTDCLRYFDWNLFGLDLRLYFFVPFRFRQSQHLRWLNDYILHEIKCIYRSDLIKIMFAWTYE